MDKFMLALASLAFIGCGFYLLTNPAIGDAGTIIGGLCLIGAFTIAMKDDR